MSQTDSSHPAIIHLNVTDNVAVVVRTLASGVPITLGDGQTLIPLSEIPVGHKLAIQPISEGEKVFKWGCPIGSATRDIAPGEHVHTHNLKSDYLPTFTFEAGHEFINTKEGTR
jgi:hypothetical protein